MGNNPDGGLIVFVTSDSDFLGQVNAVIESRNFRADLIFFGKRMSRAPGMREKIKSQGHCYEWMKWLKDNMQMPELQMHKFDKEWEWKSPQRSSGSPLVPCIQQVVC